MPFFPAFPLCQSWRWSINLPHTSRASQFGYKPAAALRLAGALALASLAAGCRQDMHNQPKFYPQRGTTFYADGRSVRPQIEHTVARTQLRDNTFFYTGLINGKEQDMLPFPATLAVLERGEERYNIYCTPCHSRVGNGAGMIVQRGYKPAGNFHDAKRLAEPLSHYFYVISNGYGAMPDYSAQVLPADRWAISAYIRALQLSQNAKLADVPQGAPIHTLHQIAESQGLPASFAQPWELPATAVQALPSPSNQGYPGGVAPQDSEDPANARDKGSSSRMNSAPGGAPGSTEHGSRPPANPSSNRPLPASSAPVRTTDAPSGTPQGGR